MDSTPLRCLINSISRFIHLVTSRISNAMPAEKDYKDIVSLLKHLKPILDDVADHKAPQDEALLKECEELDIAVNEAREFIEKWSPRTSKILCVLQNKPLVLKIQMSALKLSDILCRLFESTPSKPGLSNAQFCVKESQKLKLGQLSVRIEDVLKCQKDGQILEAECLEDIIESLKLKSSQALLNEYIAIEKEKRKTEDSKIKGKLDQSSQAVDLMSRIREYVTQLKKFEALNGIEIPFYFRCALSLELMLDPVIVASGQTFERAAIERWLDSGLVRCPKTGYNLSHKNLIPNYTVRALIANWCQENKIELPNKDTDANANKVQSLSKDANLERDLLCPLASVTSSSRPPYEVGHGFEHLTVNEEGNHVSRGGEAAKFDQSSPEHSYVHSRSESASSAVSSIDYVQTAENQASRILSKPESASDRSHDIESACLTIPLQHRISGASSPLSRKQYNSSKTMCEMVVNGDRHQSRILSFSSDSEYYNELASISHVKELIAGLRSDSTEIQTAAAEELRFLAKYNMENRIIIGDCGAIAPLISLLRSDVEQTQEHAVTALLNLSICESIKVRIAEEDALEALIHVLRTGNAGAKENTAAAIFSISLLDAYRIKIGRSAAVKALVDLLQSGTVRGKKDAATALFNLSIFHENKARIVQAGAVKYLVGFMDPAAAAAAEMVDKAVALVANLSTIPEGCSAIAREGGIPLLVEIVEAGSPRGKENAAAVLLQLCLHSSKYCRCVLQEGAVPPLVALSQSGTPRAKEKAQQLLSHFRSQRESAAMARGGNIMRKINSPAGHHQCK